MRSRFSSWSSTTSTRAMSGRREREGERASGPRCAVHHDHTAEDPGQLLADVQTEPGSLEFRLLRLADLLEGSEEPALILRCDAHTGVGDTEAHRAPVVRQAQREGNSTGLGELDGVVGQVDENLRQSAPVGTDDDLLFQGLYRELQALAFDEGPERIGHFLDDHLAN